MTFTPFAFGTGITSLSNPYYTIPVKAPGENEFRPFARAGKAAAALRKDPPKPARAHVFCVFFRIRFIDSAGECIYK
jgi:hypothetical protein